MLYLDQYSHSVIPLILLFSCCSHFLRNCARMVLPITVLDLVHDLFTIEHHGFLHLIAAERRTWL